MESKRDDSPGTGNFVQYIYFKCYDSATYIQLKLVTWAFTFYTFSAQLGEFLQFLYFKSSANKDCKFGYTDNMRV